MLKTVTIATLFAVVFGQITTTTIDDIANIIDTANSANSVVDQMSSNQTDACITGFWLDCNTLVWELETTEEISQMTLLAYSLMGLGAGSQLSGSSLSDWISNSAWATYAAEAMNVVDLMSYIWAFSMWMIQNGDPQSYSTFRNWRVGLVHALIASFCTIGASALGIAFNASYISTYLSSILLQGLGGGSVLLGVYFSFFNRDLWLAYDPEMLRGTESFDWMIW